MELQSTKIPLRERLDISPYITFGFEIEFDNISEENFKQVDDEIKKYDYTIKNGLYQPKDISIKNGGEIINKNVLSDSANTWINLYEVCKIFKDNKYATINRNTGGHIHVGYQIFENKTQLYNFIRLWAAYEHVIFRFSYGEFENARTNIEKYAKPLKRKINAYLQKNITTIDDPKDVFREKQIAFSTSKANYMGQYAKNNTIEFRVFNGTLNPIIWQNNLNFIVHLINYAKSISFNDELIDKKITSQNQYYYEEDYYSKITKEDAIELADLIFNKEIDKEYFLIQYFKSNKEIKSKSLIRTKNFTSY